MKNMDNTLGFNTITSPTRNTNIHIDNKYMPTYHKFVNNAGLTVKPSEPKFSTIAPINKKHKTYRQRPDSVNSSEKEYQIIDKDTTHKRKNRRDSNYNTQNTYNHILSIEGSIADTKSSFKTKKMKQNIQSIGNSESLRKTTLLPDIIKMSNTDL